VTQDAVSGGLNLVTRYSYDEVGDRLTQTDANSHTTSYQYDQRGRRIGRTLPLGQSEMYVYDGNGNLSSRTDFNSRTTTYTYDTVNRLLSKTADAYFVTNHIGAAAESFTYTLTGKRATMADASGTTTYGYDTRDRLATKATPEGTLSYSYDAASDVKTIQSSNTGGASMAYGYDALDRLSTVTDASGATSYTYDPVGNLGTATYPNGVAHSYTYDTRNRLTNLAVAKGATAIASYGYTLDAAGHRTSVTEQSGRKVNYGYDSIYRLTNETIASDPNAMNGAVSYAYDSVGNRLQKTSTLPGFPGALMLCTDCVRTQRFHAIGDSFEREADSPIYWKRWSLTVRDGRFGVDSGALQAGGRRFEPCHVHQSFQPLRAGTHRTDTQTIIATQRRSSLRLTHAERMAYGPAQGYS